MLVLLAFAATLSQGCTGFVESRWVAAAAWMLGVVGMLWTPADGLDSCRAARWAAGVLIGWCVLQMLPLPAFAIGWVWRGNPELLDFVAADASSFCIAVNRFVSLHTLCLWSGFGVLAWASGRHLRTRSAWQMIFVGAMGLGVFQSIAGLFFLRFLGGRLIGTFGNPDALGGLLAMTLPMTLSLIFQQTARPRLRGRTGWRWWTHHLATDGSAWVSPALWGGFAIQWLGLLFSGSVGATLATLTLCILLLAWQGREHPASRRFVFRAAAALVLLAVVFSIQGLRRNVLDRTFEETDGVSRSLASRVEIWQAGARLCRQFPMGTGPGGTATVLSMFKAGVHGRYRLDYAHNDSLQYLGDLGWIGFSALVLLLFLTGRQGFRGCRTGPSGEDKTVWLRRGAWAAFLAALLHAQAEFNLSARPGIQVLFAVVCGLLWASGDRPEAGRTMARPPVRHASLWVAGAWILVGVGAIALSLSTAWAWRLHEGVQRRVGSATFNPKWGLAETIDPDRAMDELQRANRLAPRASAILRGEAKARMALHQLRVEEVARKWLVSTDSADGEKTDLDPLDPAVREALNFGGLALRIEEVDMLQAAQTEADAAVASAPWDASARLIRARILIRRALSSTTEIEAEIRGRRDLEIATRLYPEDAGVLADATSILAIARRASDRNLLLDWGRKAIALNPSQASVVLHAWRNGGVPMEQILQLTQMPGRVLWQLYTLLDREQRSVEARQCLTVMDRVLDEDRPPADSTLWGSAEWARWRAQGAKSRLRWTRESLKHALRAGDWNMVRSLAPHRLRALDEKLAVELIADGTGDGALAMRRLRLREWAAQERLPPKWIVEWAVMELQAGQSAISLQEPLLEQFSLDAIDLVDFQRLFTFRDQLSEAPILAAFLDAKEAERVGHPAEAASILKARLGDGASLSRRFMHRFWLWQFQLLSQAEQNVAADEALVRAAEWCASDPDVMAAMHPMDKSKPGVPTGHDATGLDICYQGGRLRLNAVWLDVPADRVQEGRVVLDWRFMGRLPSDLKLELRIQDVKGRLITRERIQVDDVLEAHFNRGTPPIGSQWRTTISFPPPTSVAKRLEILLTSSSGRLHTDEGLPLLELEMERLSPFTKETVDPKGGQE